MTRLPPTNTGQVNTQKHAQRQNEPGRRVCVSTTASENPQKQKVSDVAYVYNSFVC